QVLLHGAVFKRLSLSRQVDQDIPGQGRHPPTHSGGLDGRLQSQHNRTDVRKAVLVRIIRLQTTNFRSIKSLDLELPQISALVGPNNAGKSNILLAIQRVLGRDWVSVSAFSEEDVYGRNPD